MKVRKEKFQRSDLVPAKETIKFGSKLFTVYPVSKRIKRAIKGAKMGNL